MKELRLAIVALIAVTACGRSGDDSRLLSGSASDPRFEELDRRLDIAVTVVDENGDAIQEMSIPVLSDSSPALVHAVAVGCSHAACEQASNPCDQEACEARTNLCIAQSLMQLVQSVAPTMLPVPNDWDIEGGVQTVVPPQDQESQYVMAHLAMDATRFAMKIAANSLDDDCSGTTTCIPEIGPTVSVIECPSVFTSDAGSHPSRAEVLAVTYVDALHVQDEASAEMTRAAQAIGDRQLSAQPVQADVAFLRDLRPVVGRFAAASTLVGGDGEGSGHDPLVAANGVCPSQRVEGGGEDAMRLLRLAAPPPNVVLAIDGTGAGSCDDAPGVVCSLDQLLIDGWTKYVDAAAGCDGDVDSVACRVGVLLQDPAVLEIDDADAFAAHFGLTRADFVAARARMADEIRAFDRSRSRTLPPVPIDAETSSDDLFDRYAATGSEPIQSPSIYYAAVAGYDPSPSTEFIQSNLPGVPVPDSSGWFSDVFSESVLGAIDGRTYGLRQFLASAPIYTPDGPEAESARNLVAGELAFQESLVPGRLSACWYAPDGDPLADDFIYVRIYLNEALNLGDLRLVSGRDGLDCAVQGLIDSSACSSADLAALTPTLVDGWDDEPLLMDDFTAYDLPHHYFAQVAPTAMGISSGTAAPNPEAVLFFVVRLRDGQMAGPGAYEPLAGAEMRVIADEGYPHPYIPQGSDSIYQYCINTAIVPHVWDDVATLLAPSTTDCGVSAENCAGLPSDFRIPLENELTSDGDAVESSWRHYLQIAAEAADEADQLGEDLVRNGLDMDIRAEQALNDIERICGVSVAIDHFPERTAGNCSGGSCATAGYRCDDALNLCVIDPVEYARVHVDEANRQRLVDCLGGDTVDYAVLGDRPICIWDRGSTASVCQGASEADLPCPYEPTYGDGGPSCDRAPMGATTHLLDALPDVTDPPSEALLALFHRPGEDDFGTGAPSGTGDPLPCAELAAYRAALGEGQAAALDTSSAFYTADGMHGAALTWTARVGDFSTVYAGGELLLSTGSVLTGPCVEDTDGFLVDPTCGVAAFGDRCPEGFDAVDVTAAAPSSLFCYGGFEDDRAARASMNDMLARAVLAANLISGDGLAGHLTVPLYPRASDSFFFVNNLHYGVGSTTWLGGDYRYLMTTEGQYATDNYSSGDYNRYARTFHDLGGTAYLILHPTTGDAGIEWTRRPYDRTWDLEVFDDYAADVDDTGTGRDVAPFNFDRNVPFVARVLPEEVDGDNLAIAVADWWSSSPTSLMRQVIGNYGTDPHGLAFNAAQGSFSPLADATHYWRRIPFSAAAMESQGCLTNATAAACVGSPTEYFFRTWHDAQAAGADYFSTLDGNRAFIAQRGLTRQDVMNGLELICLARERTAGTTTARCGSTVPTISTFRQAVDATAYLRCQAAEIRASTSNSTLIDLPQRVVDALSETGGTVHGTDSGEFGQEVDNLRGAVGTLGTTETQIAASVNELAGALEELRTSVERAHLMSDLEDLSLQSRVWQEATNCVTAAAHSVGNDVSAIGRGIAAAATCVNSGAQISLAVDMARVREDLATGELHDAFVRFDERFNGARSSLASQVAQLHVQLEALSAAIARIRSKRMDAQRAVARALMLDSDATGRVFPADTAMRARYNTSLIRYRVAHARAVRLSAIARIALEQRLGMTLHSMTTDLTTVEAPARWADDICSLPSIDYDALRATAPSTDGTRDMDASTFMPPDDYAGTYVGDYVRRLEQVFESYNFAYPFQDGTDQAVVSLRDEIFHSRAQCPISGPNVLYHSGELGSFRVPANNDTPGLAGWMAEGCETYEEWPEDETAPPCAVLDVIRAEDEGMMYTEPVAGGAAFVGGGANGYRLVFGSPPLEEPEGATCSDACTGLTDATRWGQWLQDGEGTIITAAEGVYRVSWYGRTTPMALLGDATAIDPADAVLAVSRHGLDGAVSVLTPIEVATPEVVGAWTRYGYTVSLSDPAQLGVVVLPGGMDHDEYSMVDLAALMLESGIDDDENVAFPAFWGTSDVLTRPAAACEDTTGQAFRSDDVVYGCESVCPTGYGQSCDPAVRTERCYYELSFRLADSSLERLTGNGGAGFAGGNYNYRIENVGVNLVGVGIHDCTAASATGPCYSSGSTSFSLLHTAPFPVRNARGEVYLAPLFDGRIEGARALTAERYITNPVSSADSSLIQPYMRAELRGRPLSGLFTLRIWNDSGLVFSRIEDIQLVLGYRYWTRQR